jgi:hypothetical protein
MQLSRQMYDRCQLGQNGKRQLNPLISLVALYLNPKLKWMVLECENSDQIIMNQRQKGELMAFIVQKMKLIAAQICRDMAANVGLALQPPWPVVATSSSGDILRAGLSFGPAHQSRP